MNAAGLLAGSQSETPLDDTGKAQARAAASIARTHKIDAILCSTQGRARETALIIAAEIGIEPTAIIYSDLLIERDFGSLEGTQWSPHLSLADAVGVEPETALIARIKQCIETHRNLGTRVLIVTHGSTARALQCVFNPELSYAKTTKLDNAQIVTLN